MERVHSIVTFLSKEQFGLKDNSYLKLIHDFHFLCRLHSTSECQEPPAKSTWLSTDQKDLVSSGEVGDCRWIFFLSLQSDEYVPYSRKQDPCQIHSLYLMH
jgi:hypothetical protein